MSNKSKKSSFPHGQFVGTCLFSQDHSILLMAGRRPASSDKDDDTVFFNAGSKVEMSMLLDEAEPFLESVLTLISDVQARPFHGSLCVDTRVGRSGGQLEIAVRDPDDHTASVTVRSSSGEVQFDAAREPLERFIFAVREGICEDVEDDD